MRTTKTKRWYAKHHYIAYPLNICFTYQEEDDDDDDEEEEDPEIDPSAIVGRRTRGIKVDYTSKEALEKAGLTAESDDDDEEMKDE